MKIFLWLLMAVLCWIAYNLLVTVSWRRLWRDVTGRNRPLDLPVHLDLRPRFPVCHFHVPRESAKKFVREAREHADDPKYLLELGDWFVIEEPRFSMPVGETLRRARWRSLSEEQRVVYVLAAVQGICDALDGEQKMLPEVIHG